ncbi:MAG: alanine--tRNA ligase [Clostridia bacterium]|nr:alanine--tRNA ligase [Clostridia bacterium]
MEFKFTSKQLRKEWLNFYKERGHVDCGAVSLIGDGSTGVMFNVAGMQPLMPYLLGKKHPMGTRLCNVQGCVRTVDIEVVGDPSHCTFFEMLGSWSLGDYFKKERTKWSYELLTQVLKFDPNRIAVTCFEGNEDVPKDVETAQFREDSGIKKENIYFLPKKENWWELERGPCGPDSEMFYITEKTACGPNCNPSCDCGRFVEVGNDVFMQYERIADNEYIPLKQKNVDTGWGLERLLVFLNQTGDVYKTDLFIDVINYMEKVLNVKYGEDNKTTRAMRIIADHTRTSVMLIGDENGILPSNIGAGYILRRLIRRAVRYANEISLDLNEITNIAKIFIEKIYNETYPQLLEKEEYIIIELNREIEKFNKALALGNKEFEKVVNGIERKNQFMKQSNPDYIEEKLINGKSAFRLYDTFGFPIELTCEMANERGFEVDVEGFNEAFRQHQELARSTSAGAFKGGLADDSEWTTRLHTACHLLLASLRKMFGTYIEQKGSNITSERLRFDFNFDRKLTDKEVQELEKLVNDAINKEIPVERLEMSFAKAKEQGGYGVHKADENEVVSVYKIGDVDFQICGGPHANNTKELVNFKVAKQEAVSAGVRRIKAIINVK